MNGGRYNNKKELGGVGGKARPEKGRGRSKGSRREQQTGVVRGERGVRYNRRRTLKKTTLVKTEVREEVEIHRDLDRER